MSDAMSEEIKFAGEHAKICTQKGSPATKKSCGRRLYRFLMKYGLELDIFYNQKQHGRKEKESQR